MKLTVQYDELKKAELISDKMTVMVGRAPQSDFVITHESVSRMHCQLEVKTGFAYITDVGSSNGTFINGKRIKPNEKIRIGEAHHIRLGRIECRISDLIPPQSNTYVVEMRPSKPGAGTVTTMIARSDQIDPELISANKPKRPRNPVTDDLHDQDIEVVESKRTYIILFILVAAVLAYFMIPIFS